MLKRSRADAHTSLLLCLFALGIITAILVVPYQFGTKAAGQKSKGLFQRTVSNEEAFPNYDIREQNGKEVADLLVGFRRASGKDLSAIANTRDEFVRGENELKARIPTLKVEYNTGLRIPEVIGPDPTARRAFLTRPSTAKRSEILFGFIRENGSLFGATYAQIDQLSVFADYMNPAGNMGFVELEQQINGIPVFQGTIKAGFSPHGEMVRVINFK